MPTMIDKVAEAIQHSFNSNDIDCYPIAKAAIAAILKEYRESNGLLGSHLEYILAYELAFNKC